MSEWGPWIEHDMRGRYPLTVYTQAMMRAAKFARKRATGRGGRRVNQ